MSDKERKIWIYYNINAWLSALQIIAFPPLLPSSLILLSYPLSYPPLFRATSRQPSPLSNHPTVLRTTSTSLSGTTPDHSTNPVRAQKPATRLLKKTWNLKSWRKSPTLMTAVPSQPNRPNPRNTLRSRTRGRNIPPMKRGTWTTASNSGPRREEFATHHRLPLALPSSRPEPTCSRLYTTMFRYTIMLPFTRQWDRRTILLGTRPLLRPTTTPSTTPIRWVKFATPQTQSKLSKLLKSI